MAGPSTSEALGRDRTQNSQPNQRRGSLEVAKGLIRITQGAVAEEVAHGTLGLHAAQISKPLVVQHLLLLAGPPHAGGLVIQPHPLHLSHAANQVRQAGCSILAIVDLSHTRSTCGTQLKHV